jgi:hypothetical protein
LGVGLKPRGPHCSRAWRGAWGGEKGRGRRVHARREKRARGGAARPAAARTNLVLARAEHGAVRGADGAGVAGRDRQLAAVVGGGDGPLAAAVGAG